MKKLNPFLTITLFLTLMSLLVSCSSSKTAVNCPTLPGSNSNPKAPSNHTKPDKKVFAYSQKKSTKTRNTKNHHASVRRYNASPAQSVSNLDTVTNKSEHPYLEILRIPARADYNKSIIASLGNSALPVESVLPIAETVINTTTNSDLTATKVKSKREHYSSTINNSGNKSFENANIPTNPYLTDSFPQDSPPKVAGLARAGFILSLVFFPLAFPPGLGLIPLGLIPIIFGAISLSKIKRNPSKFKGKGLALWSLVLGVIDLVLGVILTLTYIGD
jgi:hypothetical protein